MDLPVFLKIIGEDVFASSNDNEIHRISQNLEEKEIILENKDRK